MDKFFYKVILVFNRVVMAVPFIIGALFSFVYILGGWGVFSKEYEPGHFLLPKVDNYFLFFIGAIISVALIVIFGKMLLQIDSCNSGKWNKTIIVIIIFVVTLGTRLATIYLCKDDLVPFGDFQRVWEIAHTHLDGNIDYYSLFPAYLNYSIVEKIIIAFHDSYLCIVGFNALLCAITAVGVYFIADELCDNGKISIIAAVTYALMPSNIMYVLNGSPDFITIVFDTYAILLFIKAFKNKNSSRYAMMFAGGMLLGVANSYKAFGIIIMIAMMIVLVLKIIIDAGNNSKGKKVVILAVIFLIVSLGYKGTEIAIEKCTENVYGLELDSKTATPHFLLVGLNTKGEGQIHLGEYSRQYYETYLKNGKKYEEARDYAFNLLKDDWKKNTSDIPFLIAIKTVWGWQDDAIPLVYLGNVNTNLPKGGFNVLLGATQSVYFLIMIFAFIGCIIIDEREIEFKLLFIKLVIFGYFCLLLISEAQSRYKCLVMPYICLFTAIGVNKIVEIYRVKRGRITNE